jgi:hypothetical protein
MADWCVKKIAENGTARLRKTIKLTYVPPGPASTQPTKQEITDRVLRVVRCAVAGVTLLVAPPGSWKSTTMRAEAVAYVLAHPGETVVFLVPRHRLGDEQIKALYAEHPDTDIVAAVWRGRHQPDPEFIGPQLPGQEKQMCLRPDEAAELEKRFISVGKHLCERGRGKKKVKCPLHHLCGAQRQAATRANIWFGAHETLAHKMPKAFGHVGRVYIDESPIRALTFGVDDNDPVEIALDALKTPPKVAFSGRDTLMEAREALYDVLDPLPVPIEPWRGVPVEKNSPDRFHAGRQHKARRDAHDGRALSSRADDQARMARQG